MKFFLAQHLPMKQRGREGQGSEGGPTGEHRELTQQEQEEADIDRIAAQREYARRHQPTRLFGIDADPEAVAERHQAERQNQHPAQAKPHSDPCGSGGPEEPVGNGQGPAERGGEQRIEIEQCHRRYQEVRFVELSEMHCASAGSAQQQNSADDRTQQQHSRQSGQILRHRPHSVPEQTRKREGPPARRVYSRGASATLRSGYGAKHDKHCRASARRVGRALA